MSDTTPGFGSYSSVRTVSSAKASPTSPAGQAASPAGRPASPTGQPAPPPELHVLMSPEVNVQRIMQTGTVWFVAVVLAVGVVASVLLASGWRPALLTGGLAVIFWVASFLVALSVGLIGWSGCPILEVDVPTADRNKTLTMQLGTMLFIVGGAAALLAIMLGPAS